MKNTIKNFLLKKRIKILKSKKGFSLLEVLVAVGIIAIISAIAVPQYTANRENAAKVAGDTSVNNIDKAYKHCVALKSHTDCDSLGDLNVTCPDCSDGRDSAEEKFCADIEKTVGGKVFRACVEFDQGDTKGRYYGGAMFKDINLCHTEVVSNANGNCGTAKAKAPRSGAIICTSADVGTGKKCGVASASSGNCDTNNSCEKIVNHTTAGVCGAGTGVCTK